MPPCCVHHLPNAHVAFAIRCVDIFNFASCVVDSCDDTELLNNMQFWHEVTDCELHQARAVDRRMSASLAWNIFNKFISLDAECSIGTRRHDLCVCNDVVS